MILHLELKTSARVLKTKHYNFLIEIFNQNRVQIFVIISRINIRVSILAKIKVL